MKIKPAKKLSIPKPKPKPKGKYPKAKKIKDAGKKFDVFATFLESDAGSDSAHKTKIYEEIQKLSKPQLSRLERKIQKMQNKLISNKESNKKVQKHCSQIMQWIDDRLKYSRIQEDLLVKQIKKKVRRHQINYSEQQKQFSKEGEACSFRRLLGKYFQNEAKEIEKELESGTLLSPHRGHGASGVLKKLLISACHQAN